DYYVANKLLKGFLGGANIDTNSRLCMASAVAGHRRAFGEDAVPGCYEDFELADLIILVGSNAAWCHPVLFQRIADAKARRPQVRVVVIDPRRTATCDIADLHLPLRPGADVWLFNGLLAWLRRSGCVDREFVDAHTTGAGAALAVAETTAADGESLARICGLDAAQMTGFFRLFGQTERVVTAFSQGVNQSSAGTDKVNAIINCHLLTGRIGRPGMGPFSLTGQPNAMGGREVGAMAGELAAHLDLASEAHRLSVRRFWGGPCIPHRPGLKAVDLFAAIDAGRVKAVWIMATNPAVSLPEADRVREALRRCELAVVSDCAADTDTTRCARVLLPALAWGEKDGTVTSSERRISRQRPFLRPPGEARADWWIVCEVARRLGFGRHFAYASPDEIFAEHARLSCAVTDGARRFDLGGLAGLTREQYDALEPMQWPVRGGEAAPASTARLFGDGRFAHADGRARFMPVRPRPAARAVSEEFPLVLNTGRIRDQWHTMTRTGRAPSLAEHTPEPFIDVHGQDALLAGIREGELARLVTPWGSMIGRARTGGGIARGQVFAPMHWSAALASDARVNALVGPAVDPISGQPELKHTPARVEPFAVDWFGVLVSRHPIGEPDVAWWTMIRGEDCMRYELGGRGVPPEWPAWTRRLLRITQDGADVSGDYLDYSDEACGVYRAAHIAGDRL
ncbi:MAG: molybdopterin oxidoreductase family protein, partial [Steroidobacteraceae bacterium]